MANYKRVRLMDPISGDYLIPVVDGVITDATTLGGKPASDYVTTESLAETITTQITPTTEKVSTLETTVSDLAKHTFPNLDFSATKQTVVEENTITEYGEDFTIVTTFNSDDSITQVLTYNGKQYTKTIVFDDTNINETTEVIDL